MQVNLYVIKAKINDKWVDVTDPIDGDCANFVFSQLNFKEKRMGPCDITDLNAMSAWERTSNAPNAAARTP